tara:strand:+ start:3465 stop:3716 length:252 start_codon:yes stop_codon:yes gene_type:complete
VTTTQKNLEVHYEGWINDGIHTPTLTIRDDHRDEPAVFFSNFDAKEICDGYSLDEMLAINETMQSAIELLRREDKNQPNLFEM